MMFSNEKKKKKKFLPDYVNWDNKHFEEARASIDLYQRFSASWKEQRAFTTNAIELLGSHPLAAKIRDEFNSLQPSLQTIQTPLSGFEKISSAIQSCGPLQMSFNLSGGGLTNIGKLHSSGGLAIGQFEYHTLDGHDIDRYFDSYVFCDEADPILKVSCFLFKVFFSLFEIFHVFLKIFNLFCFFENCFRLVVNWVIVWTLQNHLYSAKDIQFLVDGMERLAKLAFCIAANKTSAIFGKYWICQVLPLNWLELHQL